MTTTTAINKSNILGLADLIDSLPDEKFEMETFLRDRGEDDATCGSPSCIAGWAAWEQQGRPKTLKDNLQNWASGHNNLINSALEFFGIPQNDWEERKRVRDELFRGNYGAWANKHLTKADASRVLREYAESGKIEWPDMPDDDD